MQGVDVTSFPVDTQMGGALACSPFPEVRGGTLASWAPAGVRPPQCVWTDPPSTVFVLRPSGSPALEAAVACLVAHTAPSRGPARCPCTPPRRTCSCSSSQVGPKGRVIPPLTRRRRGPSPKVLGLHCCHASFGAGGSLSFFKLCLASVNSGRLAGSQLLEPQSQVQSDGDIFDTCHICRLIKPERSLEGSRVGWVLKLREKKLDGVDAALGLALESNDYWSSHLSCTWLLCDLTHFM